MKRTCLQINTNCPDFSGNNDEQTTCEFPPFIGAGYRVKLWIKEIWHNHELISNFNNL